MLLKQYSILCLSVLLSAYSHAQCQDTATYKSTAPDSRYEVFGNGSEIKDKQTSLIWQRCSIGQTWDGSGCTGNATAHSWGAALKLAKDLGNGYRLPNIKELLSLVETACFAPAINQKFFPNTPSDVYWSSSPYAGNSSLAWNVYSYSGNWGFHRSNKYTSLYVRAVRGSQ